MFGTRPNSQKSDYISVFSLNPGRSAHIWVQSESFATGTHWFGRQYICTGQPCPLCEIQAPRWFDILYVAAKHGSAPPRNELLMLDVNTVAQAKLEGAQLEPGEIYSLSRPKTDCSAYLLKRVGERELETQIDIIDVVSAVCRLQRISSPRDQETLAEWQNRVKDGLIRLADQIASGIVANQYP